MSTHRDESLPMYGRLHSNLRSHKNGDYLDGYVMTPDGIVIVYAEPDKGGYTQLTFCAGDCQYRRTWKRMLSPLRIATEARRLSRGITPSNKRC